MAKLTTQTLLPAILFGGIPFYLGALFWYFPAQMSRVFTKAGSSSPELSAVLYSPKAMRIIGAFWAGLGVALWLYILL